jgi:CRP/FNR family transcriptional regulator
MIDPAILEQSQTFRGVNAAAAQALARGGTVVRYPAGAVLWTSGAPSRGLFVVLDGEVRILSPDGGRTHVVHTEGKGATLGEVPLFDSGPMPATAVAASNLTCAVFGAATLKAAIIADPEIAFRLLESLAGRVRGLVERLARRTSRAAVARLAAYLLERQRTAGGKSFTLGGSQQAVAEELGTVREVIVRGLRRLKALGLIQSVGPGRFRVPNTERLKAICTE